MNIHTVIVSEKDAGVRLDKFLASCLSEFSRSRLQSLIEGGHIFCGDRSITDASRKVKPGENWRIEVPEAKPSHIEAQDIALDIIHEDNDLLVINKPPGLTVHPAPGHHDGTLVNALLAHCGESLSGIGGVARPGIVHRIDKDTSGLIAVAKHDAAHAALSAQLADRTMKRTYAALVWGTMKSKQGSIEGNIGRHPRNRKKMTVLKKGGKHAITHYRVITTLPLAPAGARMKQAEGSAASLPPGLISLVECNLETGRTHQIRVHMAHVGNPLVGDPVYGASAQSKLNSAAAKSLSPQAKEALQAFNRQALHAKALGLIHPTTGKRMEFTCELPADMQALLKKLQ